MRFFALAILFSGVCAWAQEGYEARPTLMAPGGLLLFYGGAGPVSYRAPTPRDLPPGAKLLGEVRGEGCQQGLFIPIDLSLRPTSVSSVIGNAGFEKALAQIHHDHPTLDGLFDIKIDRHTVSIISIYRKACTEVSARGFSTGGR